MILKKLTIIILPGIFFIISFAVNTEVRAKNLEFIFDWSDLRKCTSGNPNSVQNPIFYLNNIPENTKYIQFRLTDRNVPSYNHGGGKVQMNDIKIISENEEYYGNYEYRIDPGSFKYKSPCPPGGKHTYEWSASAKNEKKKTIGKKAKSKQQYP
tara:strand:- start:27 stop:488 length:462 start_codon:yes stop_codon:yes gene_type:complete